MEDLEDDMFLGQVVSLCCNMFLPSTDDYGLPLKHIEAVDKLKPSASKKKSGKR